MIASVPPRRGYVLVLTLAIIALAAISLAGLARYSLGLAAIAQEATEELQQRWGLYSVRHLLADRAAQIIDAQTPTQQLSTPPWPKPSRVSAAFHLGTEKFTVLIADEDAKANLNAIYRRRPKVTLAAIRRMTREDGAGALSVHLAPQAGMKSPFASWGQVFDLSHASSRSNDAAPLLAASREMTCWSTEQLNLRRASDAAVREVASLVLTAKQVGELVTLRKHWGGEGIEELLAQLELRRPQLLATSRLFSTESHRYSLWVDIDNGHRAWSYLYVHDGGPVCFAW